MKKPTFLCAPLLALGLLLAPLSARAQGDLDINEATSAELERLPGIGPATAGRIIAHRDEHGPFASIDELEEVEGLSKAAIKKLKPYLAFPDSDAEDVSLQPKSLPRDTKAEARTLLERYKKEPTIREVQEAVARHVQVDAGRLRSWRTRSRLAALAPNVRGEYRYVGQFDQRLKTGGDAADTQQDTFGTQHRPMARADWDLNKLVFNPDELRVSSEVSSLVRLRESVVNQATKVYFERRRLQVELDLTPPSDVQGRVRKELRLQELVADLDSLTGGFFSKRLIESGLDPY